MKKLWIGLVWLFGAMSAVSTPVDKSREDSALEIVLSHPESRQEAESGIIVFTMKNRGQVPIHVLKSMTPFNTWNDRVVNALFKVTDANGKEVKYTGLFASAGDDAYAYMTIGPDETISKRVNLVGSYDVGKGGPFQVSFSRDLLGTPVTDQNGIQRIELSRPFRRDSSNILDIWINADFLDKKEGFSLLSTPADGLCKAEENSVLDAALSRAKKLTQDTIQYHAGLWYSENSGGQFTFKLKEDFRRNNWMGDYDDNWLPTSDSGWFDTENFFPIHTVNTIAARLGVGSFRTLTFDCSCPPEWNTSPTTAAVTLANQVIGICPFFFTLADKGFNTKAGVLVHETTHFEDDLAPKMIDDKYGTGDASELARTNKSGAMRNPDNYKFFIESGDL